MRACVRACVCVCVCVCLGLHCPFLKIPLARVDAGAALAIPIQCMQYFPVSKQWYGCQCLGFLTCAQMLMQAIAHGGCTDSVRESALEADWEKIPCRTAGDSNPRQYGFWRFSRTLYQLSYQLSYQLPTELSRQRMSHSNGEVCRHIQFARPFTWIQILTSYASV